MVSINLALSVYPQQKHHKCERENVKVKMKTKEHSEEVKVMEYHN